MPPPSKELQAHWKEHRNIHLRPLLERALQAWFKGGAQPGALPKGKFLIDGVEYTAKHCRPQGDGFIYTFHFSDAQAIPVFVRVRRQKAKRDPAPLPEAAE